MSDTRTRAAKLAAMAAATESPHEAAAAAAKLAAMLAPARARRQEFDRARDSAVMRLCEIPDCGLRHYGRGLCYKHWNQEYRSASYAVIWGAPRVPTELKCGAETFDGWERRRCTRPASAVRDGLLVCHQHGELDFVLWAGERGARGREWLTGGVSLPPEAVSVPEIPARASVPRIAARSGGWRLFDRDGLPATRPEDFADPR
jgi:predicted secreted protein